MLICFFFFFNDTATTEIYTLSLHDALPISERLWWTCGVIGLNEPIPDLGKRRPRGRKTHYEDSCHRGCRRSEEHTSELQSLAYLVCRLLLEKKKTTQASESLMVASHVAPVL